MRALTARQRQVLLHVAAGYTSIQSGRLLGIDATTVAKHLAGAYQFLGANDRAHAVALAIYHGHITLAELAAIAAASSVRGGEGPRAASGTAQGAQEPARALGTSEALPGPQRTA